jgi:hypothetical protein
VEQKLIDVSMKLDEEALSKLARIQGLFRLPNKATAVVQATEIVDELASYQIGGWEIRLHKNGYDTLSYTLPIT